MKKSYWKILIIIILLMSIVLLTVVYVLIRKDDESLNDADQVTTYGSSTSSVSNNDKPPLNLYDPAQTLSIIPPKAGDTSPSGMFHTVKIDVYDLMRNPCRQLSTEYISQYPPAQYIGVQGPILYSYAAQLEGIEPRKTDPSVTTLFDPMTSKPISYQAQYDAGIITKDEQIAKERESIDKIEKDRADYILLRPNIWRQYVAAAENNYLETTIRDKDSSCFSKAKELLN